MQEALVSFVNYSCFIYGDEKLLATQEATYINNRILRCPIYKNNQEVAVLQAGKYAIGVSARKDVPPTQYKTFHVLNSPVLTEIKGIKEYVYKNTPIDMQIKGIWSWYEGLDDPLVILRKWPDGQILEVTTGKYASTNKRTNHTRINVTLPGTNEDQIIIQVT